MTKKEIIGDDGKVYEVKEKKKKGKGCLIIVGVLVILGIIGALMGGNDSKNKTNPQNPSATSSESNEQEEKIYTIGEPVNSDKFSITVNSKAKTKELVDESGYFTSNPTDGSSFYLLNVSISNTSNDPISLSNSSFKLMNGEKSYVSTIDILSKDSITFDTLNPDQTMTGNLIFEVPDSVIDNEGFVLKLSGSIFSGDLKGDTEISLEGPFAQ